MLPSHSREAIVTVRTYKNGIMSGYLQHPQLREKEEFQSLSQMMLLLDGALGLEGCPAQAPAAACRWEKPAKGTDVFRIQILFREHYTWQGRLIWQNENLETVFHSAIELLQLLDEILAE